MWGSLSLREYALGRGRQGEGGLGPRVRLTLSAAGVVDLHLEPFDLGEDGHARVHVLSLGEDASRAELEQSVELAALPVPLPFEGELGGALGRPYPLGRRVHLGEGSGEKLLGHGEPGDRFADLLLDIGLSDVGLGAGSASRDPSPPAAIVDVADAVAAVPMLFARNGSAASPAVHEAPREVLVGLGASWRRSMAWIRSNSSFVTIASWSPRYTSPAWAR